MPSTQVESLPICDYLVSDSSQTEARNFSPVKCIDILFNSAYHSTSNISLWVSSWDLEVN